MKGKQPPLGGRPPNWLLQERAGGRWGGRPGRKGVCPHVSRLSLFRKIKPKEGKTGAGKVLKAEAQLAGRRQAGPSHSSRGRFGGTWKVGRLRASQRVRAVPRVPWRRPTPSSGRGGAARARAWLANRWASERRGRCLREPEAELFPWQRS